MFHDRIHKDIHIIHVKYLNRPGLRKDKKLQRVIRGGKDCLSNGWSFQKLEVWMLRCSFEK